MSEPETVTIPVLEYEALLAERRFLQALDAAGVDNWEGYEMAFDILDGKEI